RLGDDREERRIPRPGSDETRRVPPPRRRDDRAQGPMSDRSNSVLPATLVVALAFALPTWFYPYGRDQGILHYVGSEWLRNGAVPYRDLVDQRPPGLHFLYGVLALGFGDRLWPIRVVDMLLVFALGWACAAIMTPREQRVPAHTIAFAILFSTVCYLGFFNFW